MIASEYWPVAALVVVVAALAIRLFWRRGRGPWDVS